MVGFVKRKKWFMLLKALYKFESGVFYFYIFIIAYVYLFLYIFYTHTHIYSRTRLFCICSANLCHLNPEKAEPEMCLTQNDPEIAQLWTVSLPPYSPEKK